ncbi:MAG TPA: hypothetical protein PKH00_00600 [Bacilli bacterium]|jgi:hypothetical protein|nr:hypothetical protein [Bacilli bacterium]HHV14902.1 hypothetical protein [Acholeplasmataceae bacterium]HNZ73892.1 hypothetical protein [Bacilli bacterium]HPA98687.1 hypothetical protein [Bacilli bacterium]HQO93500.1 hypothetical protein [Bacilli bacterium]
MKKKKRIQNKPFFIVGCIVNGLILIFMFVLVLLGLEAINHKTISTIRFVLLLVMPVIVMAISFSSHATKSSLTEFIIPLSLITGALALECVQYGIFLNASYIVLNNTVLKVNPVYLGIVFSVFIVYLFLLLFFYKKTKMFKYTGFIFLVLGVFSFAFENQIWLIALGSVTVFISLVIGIRELKVYNKDLDRGVKVQITTIVFMLLMLARFVFMFGL